MYEMVTISKVILYIHGVEYIAIFATRAVVYLFGKYDTIMPYSVKMAQIKTPLPPPPPQVQTVQSFPRYSVFSLSDVNLHEWNI